MAKRDRVPRRKQLGGHQRRRNTNPKLSPFQREQKRDRLANQPPVRRGGNSSDFPRSARHLEQFLNARREAYSKLPSPACSHEAAPLEAPGATSSACPKRDAPMASLNASLADGILPAAENPVVKRLQKKEKLSQKRKTKRREARIAALRNDSAQLDALIKGRSVDDVATSVLQVKKRGKKRAPENPSPDDTTQQKELPSSPRDFTDLVDHVRFGDRNDAPPTLDVIPMPDPSLLPQHHLGKAKRARLQHDLHRQRVAMTLAKARGEPIAITPLARTPLPDGSELVSPTVKGGHLETADDFAKLRERVMARYSSQKHYFFQTRRAAVFDTKSV